MLALVAKIQSAIGRLIDEEKGQGLTEYTLLFLLIVIISIAALTLFGQRVTTELSTIATTVANATS